ncbi:MAG: agglutinin biogenesis protein MshI [Gallionellales bacterium RIFCSPLOWO2_12_FULL_59_22]|nr:MAG: agglutinin biogenesis protein MshI [Gallionellales bacterium RIFCSPLOWO2_02_FULL_59_110]OGT03250.1 MAG: agglutinin biogenesis protein MshI [Gallionellales bacterium RIFCSPLOWO2_02_58_13]OGT13986.1 MAG: agglutinin biogenesis protein MshI [Gallionellales bacterium RIFCSPLOWO2_12_FULL_59_22]
MKIPLISSLFGTRGRAGGRFAIGLGAHGIYLAKVKFSGALPHVVRCEYHETGAVSAAALAKLCREAGIGGHHFTTLLMPGEYQLLLVEAPNVPAEELKTAIRWKIKDGLSYSVDDATVDVLQIPASNSGPERAQSLYAVAASNDVIRKHMALFEQAKIDFDVIDIPEMAQRNIAALFEQEERALAMLVFDDYGGLLTFTSGGELYLTRRIEISAGQLQDANENLREQSRDRVELELQRSLDYFDRQFNHLTVSRILVCAPESTGLVEFLSSTMGANIEKLDLSQVLDISAVPALADCEFASYALTALGAALRRVE